MSNAEAQDERQSEHDYFEIRHKRRLRSSTVRPESLLREFLNSHP